MLVLAIGMSLNLDKIATSPRGGLICQGDARSTREDAHLFDLVVFCAEEHPPDRTIRTRRAGRVLYAPNDDGELTDAQVQIARQAARVVAADYRAHKRILVTCAAGRNRSGLVVALALHDVYGIGGDRAGRVVRRMRRGANALTNPSFNRYLSRIAPEQPHRRVRQA